MALALLLAVGALGALAFGGDDDEGVDSDTSPLPVAPREGGALKHARIGASIRKPRRWSHRRTARSLTLRSPDRTVILSVSLPPRIDRSAVVLETGVAAIRREYREVKVVGSVTQRVADLPTNSVVTEATNRRGVKLRILTSAPQGRRRAWLVQVFSAAGTEPKRVAEAQVAIGTLRLSG